MKLKSKFRKKNKEKLSKLANKMNKKIEEPKGLLVPNRRGPKRKIKQYVREKCHYIDEKGIRCSRLAIGSGQLCKKHGGVIDKDNTLSPADTKLYLKFMNSSFDPAVHPLQMIKLSKDGLSDVEIAAEMEVSVGTLKTWSETFEEFAIAYDIGQALYESWWLEKGKTGLNQRNFNTSLYKFLTANKLGYAEKVETKNFNLNTCGVLVAPAKQSLDEWETSGNVIG